MKKNVAIKFLGVMAAMVMAVNFSAFAVPSSEEINIVSGDVSIARTESTLTFNVSSPKAIINFDSFNVDEGQHVIFSGSNSELLARVTGGEASFINGNITSDLLLLAFVNSAGINIGPNANITAPSLILSTRDITNVNFMGGDLIFEKVDSVTKDMLLLNRGTINITNGGFGVMIAGAVENQGVIVAKGGTIALAGGDAVKLEISPERRISVAITKETASYITDYDGNSVLDQIKNSGTLNADGGQILVRAESINDIFRSAINLEGIVSATKVEE
ncbi:MAG TPA: filamentous hemagglutinin N-terminal domain-containing protein, partial [Candidatus Omnitrophota bacterium]|nr:filamentous hemagglutinin N-terminal domain-containing protein [Candidatus Omnitrophota bacterium]